MTFNLPFLLPDGWTVKTVDSLVEEDILYKPLDGNHGSIHPKSSDYVESGVPFVMASDLEAGQVNFSSCYFISKEQASLLRKGFSKGGDVLLSHKATIGRTAIVQDSEFDSIVLTPQVTYYRIKNNKRLNNLYLKAYFDSNFFQSILSLWAGAGSTRAYLGITAQLKLPVIVPPIDCQLSIAKQVGSIDRKIELNRQTNQTLEQIAQAIFKSWFVDFEPTRAKIAAKEADANSDAIERAAMCVISGKSLEQLDQLSPATQHQLKTTAALFPDALVESELGEIPEGWGIKKIEDVLDRLKPSVRYGNTEVLPFGKVPVYEQGADILLGYHNDAAGFNASPDEPMFIFGDHTCVIHLSCEPFDVSQNVIPLAGKSYPTIWVYYAIQGKQEFQEYRRHWSELIIKEIVVPGHSVSVNFSQKITKLYLQKEQLVRESKSLEQIRDSLLPKLLSGELNLI